MAVLLNRGLEYATIERDENSDGQAVYNSFGDDFDWEWYSPKEEARVRRNLEKVIMTGLAGLAAEKHLTGRNNYVRSSEDMKKAFMKTVYFCWGNGEGEAYINWLFLRCLGYVAANWHSVEAVAKELMAKKRLTGREIRKIIRTAHLETMAGWQAHARNSRRIKTRRRPRTSA